VQLNGGIAVTWEHDVHLYLRRVTVDRNISGTRADHREPVASLLLEPQDLVGA
jgi:alkylation response protein AidB-like acyl-CoA dehydrogenase